MPSKIRSLIEDALDMEGSRLAERFKGSKLWTIALGKPKSKRFSQLSFEGFRPRGKNKLERLFFTFFEFLTFFSKYIKRKFRKSFTLQRRSTLLALNSSRTLKGFVVRKLIWSRGKLARPIATSFVMSVAFLVFIFGKVLNSNRFVNSQEIDPGYLASVTDIIPQRTTAITQIPESRKRAEPFDYTVQAGDSLSSIGSQFRISVDALKYVNNLTDSSLLKPGQVMVIPPIAGLIHKVEEGDTLATIAEKYEVAPQAVADFNYILDTSNLAIGTELVIPDAKIPQPVYVVPIPIIGPNLGIVIAPPGGGGWCLWPTTTRIITQYFSWYHNGLDIATPLSSALPPLFACSEGTVTRSGWDPFGLGLHVKIDHGNGYQSIYGHMSRVDVGYGENVSKGQAIGIMGSTGRSTGPHVHFILQYNGIPQNPLDFTN